MSATRISNDGNKGYVSGRWISEDEKNMLREIPNLLRLHGYSVSDEGTERIVNRISYLFDELFFKEYSSSQKGKLLDRLSKTGIKYSSIIKELSPAIKDDLYISGRITPDIFHEVLTNVRAICIAADLANRDIKSDEKTKGVQQRFVTDLYCIFRQEKVRVGRSNPNANGEPGGRFLRLIQDLFSRVITITNAKKIKVGSVIIDNNIKRAKESFESHNLSRKKMVEARIKHGQIGKEK